MWIWQYISTGKSWPGDVVCDPMCGSGSISVQVSLGWGMLYVILCVDLILSSRGTEFANVR